MCSPCHVADADIANGLCVPVFVVNPTQLALATAVRYAHVRRQFGEAGKPERRLIDYPIHQVHTPHPRLEVGTCLTWHDNLARRLGCFLLLLPPTPSTRRSLG